MDYVQYFSNIENSCHRQYEAVRAFFYEKIPVSDIADNLGYTVNAVYSLIKIFKQNIQKGEEPFFKLKSPGRKPIDKEGNIRELIITLRKQYLAVTDIKPILDAKGYNVSQRYVSHILKQENFARLPRRNNFSKRKTLANAKEKIKAPISKKIFFSPEEFRSEHAGILCMLPYLKEYGIDEAIKKSLYPETKVIDKQASILSFLALKLSNIRRYNADDLWCMDRGLGLFAGLNVLPKTAWFSSYSSRVTREMNLDFLKTLHKIWNEKNLLSDTMNMDFTAIPYWGDDAHLENNWSGKRHKALASILAVLAQDPESGIIDYGDTNIRHKNQANVVLEFLDFYKENSTKPLNYLIFDSKFTPYYNLKKIDEKNIKFITIRRRGKNIVEHIESVPKNEWKKVHIMQTNGKGRYLKVYEQQVNICKEYDKPVRQIAIAGHGKIQPALIITNDFAIKREEIVKKYARRWLVEKGIAEQIDFFHFNRVSSSMVIKVDFDFTMTILAHNIYRIFAKNLEDYSHLADKTIFEKFLSNAAYIEINEKSINIALKKKRNLPSLLSCLNRFKNLKFPWLNNLSLNFSGDSTT